MSSEPPKEPSTEQPVTDSASADRSADQAGGGESDRSSSPRTGEPNANASHFDESDQNADNAGTNADRRRAKADSIGMFGSNNSGYFVFGDFHQTIGSSSVDDEGARRRAIPRLDPVDAQTVAELAEVYVAPPDFRDATVPFAQGHHLLLLGTRPRWGNVATAIRLLAGLPTLYRLPVTDDLSALPVDRLEEGCGYILDATAGPALAVLGLHDIETLDAALAQRRSRLVVLADLARAADHSGRPMWRALTAPPSAYDVVIAHLTWRIASAGRAAELVASTGLDDELRGTSGDTFDIDRLVELASDLAETTRNNGTTDEARDRFAARAARAVEHWLDEEVTDPEDLALVLALAVLNGMPYDAVSRSAVELERRWAAADVAGSTGGPGRRRRNRRSRLEAARARLTIETWRTRYGPAQLEIASFLDDTYPQRILRHYWHEYDYDRDLLLDWLRGVADDVEVRVCTQAAVAIGYLGTFAFDTVRRDVITPWAGSNRGDERELAVAALALPARNPDTAGRAVRLVVDWSRRNGEAARLVAARALGSSVGPVLGDGPDAALDRLAKGADGRLATALGDSIAELMVDANPQRQAELLGLLDNWSQQGRNKRQRAGVFGFLQVAWTLRTDVDGTSWPTLLWITTTDTSDRIRATIAALWGRALIAPGADNGVRVVLGAWAEAAQRHPEQRPAFVRLMAEAATTPRQATLLTTYAERLRTRKPAAPDIARKLLDALMQGARHA